MKKTILFLIPLFFFGCEKEFDNTIDSLKINYQVEAVSTFDSYTYIPDDSLITINIFLDNSEYIEEIYINITSSAGTQLNETPVYLKDNGLPEFGDVRADDDIFSNKFPLSEFYPNGIYTIDYFITDISGSTKRVAIHSFNYDNGQENIPPVISNLVAPDTVRIGSTSVFIPLSVDASDSNGADDIELVFFNSFIPPDGHPSSNNPFVMFDDGSIDHGDAQAGDGTYSLIVELPPSGVTPGTYRWEFQARDRGKKLSNIITHFIEIF